MNTNLKHTPGPWRSYVSGANMQGYQQPFAIAQQGEPNLIAGCFGDVRGGEQVAQANAALIASAPCLLESLQLAVVTIERLALRHGPFSSVDGTLSVARAAIRKATTI